MFRHFISSINYKKLIEMQANSCSGKINKNKITTKTNSKSKQYLKTNKRNKQLGK